MRNYHCVDLNFKNKSISDETFHAHVFIKRKEIFIRIFADENSNLDTQFMISLNSFGKFDDNFLIIKSEFQFLTEGSKIYQARSFEHNSSGSFFSIFLTSICIIRPNVHKEDINCGRAYLNHNGLNIVNNFYSFFTNFRDKNKYEISRMNGMHDFYSFSNIEYRPELDFSSNEQRASKGFTVKKIPIIYFKFKELTYDNSKNHIDTICSFLSFCYGVRVIYNKFIYRTSDYIYVYYNNEKLDLKYKSKFATIFSHLKDNYRIENILKTNWDKKYLEKKTKIDKAIDNCLHSSEVESSAKYLLLFNIIEIFSTKITEDKFDLNNSKEQNLINAYEILKQTLKNEEDIILFKKKWDGIINKIFIKPLEGNLENILISNNIKSQEFGFSFNELKKIRDKLTHGSVNSIKEEKLKEYIFAIRKICICLILSQLGFGDELQIDK